MLLRKNSMTAGEAVEHISRRRARVLPVIVLMFILLQFSLAKTIALTGGLDFERTISWLLLTSTLLLTLASSGIEGLIYKDLRPFLNDELTQSHRQRAQACGFWAGLFASAVLLISTFWIELSALQVLHAVLTLAIAAAALRYAQLERRAFR